jgi:hypothetical protein
VLCTLSRHHLLPEVAGRAEPGENRRGHLDDRRDITGSSRQRRDDEAIPVLDPDLKAELKRLALLFLISALTLVLVLADAALRAVGSSILPGIVFLMLQLSWIGGAVATYFYGLYVTIRAKAWGWVVPCAVPLFGSVPASVAYSWIRRGQLERHVMEEDERRRKAASGRRRS